MTILYSSPLVGELCEKKERNIFNMHFHTSKIINFVLIDGLKRKLSYVKF